MQTALKELQRLKVRHVPDVSDLFGPEQAGVADSFQRMTVISQLYELDRLVVEGGISVRPIVPGGKPMDECILTAIAGKGKRWPRRNRTAEGHRVSQAEPIFTTQLCTADTIAGGTEQVLLYRNNAVLPPSASFAMNKIGGAVESQHGCTSRYLCPDGVPRQRQQRQKHTSASFGYPAIPHELLATD